MNTSRTQLAILTDGQLLSRYATRGNQEAFAVLVQRHGPMVLGVCRRVLQHDQDTEDAFQAAFAILARKANSILKHDSVASWLYKVAYRIALRLRMDEARGAMARLAATRIASAPERGAEEGLGEVVRQELRQVLDEEVHRLPEKYRAPILLCYLQGQTNEEAAALLHCPTGTIKIRLLRGREMLRKRLVKRGMALSLTASLGMVLEDMARAAVPQPLNKAAALAATSKATPAVSAMVQSALKGMCLAKLKVVAVVMLTLALTCLADGLLNRVAGAPVANQHIIPREMPPTSLQQRLLASSQEVTTELTH